MIQRFVVEKILSVCEKHGINRSGCAYSFGDQKPAFSKEWLETAKDKSRRGTSRRRRDLVSSQMKGSDFFKSIGYSDYFDVDYNGNARLLLDLGSSLPRELYDKADILFDGGVIEHIPNIYQAMCNAMLLLKKGGLFIECVPAACFGGGCYYNVDPTLFRDFYEANGFETIECTLYCDDIKFRRLHYFKGILKLRLKPFVPDFIMAYRKRTMRAKNDDLRSLRFIDPFDPMVRSKFCWYGPPAGTHVCYIGIKRRDIKADGIIIPRQDNYPSKIAMCT